MTKTPTIQTYLRDSVLRYAGLGLGSVLMVSVAISFLLAREQATSDLEKSAAATVQAFQDRIMDGDIRSVEPQIRQVLRLDNSESAQVLKPDLSRVYDSFAATPKIEPCSSVGATCFDGYFGQARIFYPIYLSQGDKTPYRYLYLSKHVRVDWIYWATILLVFVFGYVGLAAMFLRVSKVASGKLSREIVTWSARLQVDAKNATPLVEPPFSELIALKSAIDGLHLQIAKYERTATDQAKLLILRGIAHDLLTPVSQMQFYVATLEEAVAQSEHSETISDIKDSLKKLTAVASQVKSLKTPEPTDEPTDLVAAALSEVESLRNTEEVLAKGIRIEFSAECTEVTSRLSVTEVSRIVSNLVHNAVGASSNGSSVDVGISSQDGIAVLSVSDRGSGIPTSAQNRVFDPDFTLKPRTGTGLGLTIVKYICDQRSAKIELASEVNQGTKITIRVPAILGGAHV